MNMKSELLLLRLVSIITILLGLWTSPAFGFPEEEPTTQEAVEKAAETAAEKAAEKTLEKVTEKIAEEAAEKVAEKAAEKAMEKAAEEKAAKAEMTSKRPAEWFGPTKVKFIIFVWNSINLS